MEIFTEPNDHIESINFINWSKLTLTNFLLSNNYDIEYKLQLLKEYIFWYGNICIKCHIDMFPYINICWAYIYMMENKNCLKVIEILTYDFNIVKTIESIKEQQIIMSVIFAGFIFNLTQYI